MKTKISKISRRGKTVIALLIAVMFVSVATAAVIPYFGQVKTTATVKAQAVEIGEENGNPSIDWHTYNNPIENTIPHTSPGGEIFCFKQWIRNSASVPVDVTFDTNTYAGITTTYWKLESMTETVEEAYNLYWGPDPSGPLYNLDGENDFCAINHNVDFTVEQKCNEVVFKICTPDGFTAESCCGFDPLDDTAAFFFDVGDDGGTGFDGYDFQVMYEPGSGQQGWPVGEDFAYADIDGGWHDDHYALDTIEGVSAEKTETCLIVTISTDKLGGLGSSYGHWLRLHDHTGLMGCPIEGPDQLLVTPGEIDGMTVGTEITSLTIQSGDQLPFCICYEFDLHIGLGTYVMTTTVDATKST